MSWMVLLTTCGVQAVFISSQLHWPERDVFFVFLNWMPLRLSLILSRSGKKGGVILFAKC